MGNDPWLSKVLFLPLSSSAHVGLLTHDRASFDIILAVWWRVEKRRRSSRSNAIYSIVAATFQEWGSLGWCNSKKGWNVVIEMQDSLTTTNVSSPNVLHNLSVARHCIRVNAMHNYYIELLDGWLLLARNSTYQASCSGEPSRTVKYVRLTLESLLWCSLYSQLSGNWAECA